jgi:2-polyprenyl-3-methyl-5-hydroxy-6-metoxy-1,4-benzoquinol methylase
MKLNGDVEEISCNNCGSTKYKPYQKNSGFNIVKCSDCDLIYVNPQPTIKYLIKFYSEGEYTAKTWESKPSYEKIVDDGRLKVVNFIASEYKDQKIRLLDIGGGMNPQYKYMENKKWYVLGTELSKTFVKYAQQQKLNVVFGDAIDMKFKNKEFDAVTIMAVVEHLKDPKKYLLEAHRILKDNGVLVIKIPNLHYTLKKSTTLPISQAGHLFYYTPKTIKILFEKCGYKIIKNEPVLECGSENILKHMMMISWDKVSRAIYKLIGIHTNLQMVIYAKKKMIRTEYE